MQPGIAHRVLHRDRKMHLDAPVLLEAIDELAASLDSSRRPTDTLLLIGRRELRSNNSWMHNVPALVSGRPRCVLLVHPDDAAARRRSRRRHWRCWKITSIAAKCRCAVSDEMRPGVVSLPHGWGHAASARWQQTAGAHAGVSANDWTDDQQVESVVGQSILNGVRVRLKPKPSNGNGAVHSAAETAVPASP